MNMDMESSGVEYADHDVQALSFQITTPGSAQDNEFILTTEPVQERGIDNDELAELVAMYRTVRLTPSDEQTASNVTAQGISGEANFGINNDQKSEQLTDLPANNTLILEDGPVDGFGAIGGSTDPGILDGVGLAGFETSSSGPTAERFMNFKHELGSGPYVDRTDDLVFAGEVNSRTEDNLILEYSVILYWNTTEMPEGRPSFARP